jgi:hypothetical protein
MADSIIADLEPASTFALHSEQFIGTGRSAMCFAEGLSPSFIDRLGAALAISKEPKCSHLAFAVHSESNGSDAPRE